MIETKKAPPDWERIELDYRAGVLSVREIGVDGGVSHTAIQKRAKREGWTRDLAAKIKARADELVAKREVAKLVASGNEATERVIIEANAERIAQVKGEHRANAGRSRDIVLKLLAELEHQTGHGDLYERLAELLIDPTDEEGEANEAAKKRQRDRMEAFNRAMSLGNRSGVMKSLAESLRITVAIERQSYGLDSDTSPDDGQVRGSVSYRANIPPRG